MPNFKLLKKKIKANRSGAEAIVVDESETTVTLEYKTSFKGIYTYDKESVLKYWTVKESN
jgi:hypothetical protein